MISNKKRVLQFLNTDNTMHQYDILQQNNKQYITNTSTNNILAHFENIVSSKKYDRVQLPTHYYEYSCFEIWHCYM
mgnify:CR=1 FL=1